MSTTSITVLVKHSSTITSLVKDNEGAVVLAISTALDLDLIEIRIQYLAYQSKPIVIESNNLTDEQIIKATATLYHTLGQLSDLGAWL